MQTSRIREFGDHFLIGLRPSAELDPRDKVLLEELRPAGIILFKSNFLHGQPYDEWLASHRRLIDDIRAAVGRDKLLIAIDHEGGRVCRTPPPLTRFGYAAQYAEEARVVGAAMGTELASLAINLSFAPVLDINSNPVNPVIGARSFGTTAESVSKAAIEFMNAIQGAGVLPCGKHFPGHGDTDKDSHHELPVLRQSLDALRARELKPFEAAIAAGIPMLMTGHILVPAVDSVEPVTLSRRFNHDVLRQELRFQGVVVSDDIGMHAVSQIFNDPTAAVRLLLAGTDMMMVCSHWTDTERSRGFAEALMVARRDGTISEQLLEMSRERIARLLSHAPDNRVQELSAEVISSHQKVGALYSAETVEVV